MSRARDLANVADDVSTGTVVTTASPSLGRRNLLINSDFQVSQRGNYSTAFTYSSNTYYVDRFVASVGGVTATFQHLTRKVRLEATSTASGSFGLYQRIELSTMNKFNGQQVTLSAKVKSNSSNATLGAYTDGYQTNGTYHTGDETEQTLTFTFTVPSSALSGEFSVFIGISGATAGTAVAVSTGDYIEITEVQLEVGTVATPFEHRSYGEELLACTRYYQKITNCVGIANSTTIAQLTVNFPVEMRASPTINSTTARVTDHFHSDYSTTNAAADYGNAGTKGVRFNIRNLSGMTAYRLTSLVNVGTNAAPIYFDAEL